MQNLVERVDRWVDDVLSECDSAYSAVQCRQKRRHCGMDEQTPRAKKMRTILPTPDTSEQQDESQDAHPPSILPPPSSIGSTNTDKSKRSRSPQKRVRDADSLLLKPDYKKVPLRQLQDWERRHESIVTRPLFDSLRQSITAPADMFIYDDFFEKDLDRIFSYLVDVPDGADENHWSDDIVSPCMRLAAELTHRRQVRAINVKNIGITDPTLLGAPDEKPDTRRVDYCFGVDVVDPTDPAHGPILRYAERYLCQSIHPQIYDKVLFSHLELKTDTDKVEAHAQLKTWASAGFAKQRRLRESRRDCEPTGHATLLAPQPVWIWLSDKVEVFIVVAEWENEHIWFLPQKNFALDIYEKESLRNLVSAMSRVMEWGATVYLDWFRAELLGMSHLNPER